MNIQNTQFQKLYDLVPDLWKKGIVYVLLLTLGIGLGWLFKTQAVEERSVVMSRTLDEVREDGYQYINPLLECDLAEEVGSSYYKASFDNASDIIEKYKEEGKINEAAVYFRDLNNGPWYSINEELLFEPASLYKLPLLISYYRKAELEKNPQLLDKKIPITMSGTERQATKPEKSAEVGKEYTVRELLQIMIAYSDNNAAIALFNNLSQEERDFMFDDLGLVSGVSNSGEKNFQISVKNYSSMFRLLFNGSYLNKDSSEEVLKILANTTYTKGIREAIPADVEVAHKFGERQSLEGDRVIYQLHDCGIVYYPKHPFLLCIMSKGPTEAELPNVIRDLATDIFIEFDQKITATATR